MNEKTRAALVETRKVIERLEGNIVNLEQPFIINLLAKIDDALKSEPHKAKDGKYVIWLTPGEADKLCEKYELEDYYFGLDDRNRKSTTAELVEELRKRDGVEVVEVPETGQSNVLAWSTQTRLNYPDLIYDKEINGAAIILRITDSKESE